MNLQHINYLVDLGLLGEADVVVTYRYYPGDPGRVSGPPEHCYPPEPAELEVLKVEHPYLSLTGAAQLVNIIQHDSDFEDAVAEAMSAREQEAAESYAESVRDADRLVEDFWR